ncbi:MAG: pilus assembly protein PilM [Micrococcales bacterium]|nr:pilus assembly protein PilM [Micrococcales bacterium]
MSASKVVGLDIGTGHLRAVEVTPGRGGSPGTVTRVAEVELPAGAVRDGEVAEPHTVATTLRRLWSKAKFSGTDVVLGVGNQRVIVRDLEMPSMPQPQIKAALPFQVAEMLPVAVEDALLDYMPLSQSDSESGPVVDGLLVAATKDTVKANVAAVQLAKLTPVAVDLAAFAQCRALLHTEMLGHVVGLVDVGARVTTVVVAAYGVPRVVRLLAAGGQDVTDALVDTLSISPVEAEGLKRRVGFGQGSTPETAQAADVIGSVTRAAVEAIRNTFVYYAASNPGNGVTGIVMTGGGVSLPGFGQYLSNSARLPVTIGQPFDALEASPRAGIDASRLARQHEFTMATGLALRSAA